MKRCLRTTTKPPRVDATQGPNRFGAHNAGGKRIRDRQTDSQKSQNDTQHWWYLALRPKPTREAGHCASKTYSSPARKGRCCHRRRLLFQIGKQHSVQYAGAKLIATESQSQISQTREGLSQTKQPSWIRNRRKP